MYKFSVNSNLVLGILTLFALMSFIAIENSKVPVKQKWYSQKLQAANLSQKAALHIKDYRMKKGIFIDNVNDPNETALIGQEFTPITTDRGSIDAKLSTTNPNYAAVILQLLKEAGLNRNDVVCVAMTGSFPGLNISVLAAIEILNLNPIIISSVGASNWGANDPYFTWLDMESYLVEEEILQHRSTAASMGGGRDRGRGLSPEGRKLILEAIERNHVELIHEEFLSKSIEKRIKIYNKFRKNKLIKAYINVGGGIASLGSAINGRIIPSGLNINLPMKNYPERGVIVHMAQQGIPVIHLLNISRLEETFGLHSNSTPLPEPGTGEIFVNLKYSMTVTLITGFLLLIAIMLVYYADKNRHRLGKEFMPHKEEHISDEI